MCNWLDDDWWDWLSSLAVHQLADLRGRRRGTRPPGAFTSEGILDPQLDCVPVCEPNIDVKTSEVDPGLPRGGRPTLRREGGANIWFCQISEKLYKLQRIWTCGSQPHVLSFPKSTIWTMADPGLPNLGGAPIPKWGGRPTYYCIGPFSPKTARKSKKKQECISVGCLPTVRVLAATTRFQYQLGEGRGVGPQVN